MLIEIAIGDTYGVGFEYRTEKFVTQNNRLEKYFPHMRYRSLFKKYSDDTQMSIAIAELILDHGAWHKILIADYFVKVFKRDIRPGYSSRLYNVLMKVKNGKEFCEKIKSDSDRSGAAMRSGPIGLYPDIDEVLQKAELQAKVTHDTVGGVQSAQAASLLVHFFAYNHGPKAHVGEYIKEIIGGNWNEPWYGTVGEKGSMSVRAAITSIARNNKMTTLLKDCISFSGDVDTVASIAAGGASFCQEIENNLPEWMYAELENEKYGKDYILQLDNKLQDKFSIKN